MVNELRRSSSDGSLCWVVVTVVVVVELVFVCRTWPSPYTPKSKAVRMVVTKLPRPPKKKDDNHTQGALTIALHVTRMYADAYRCLPS